MVWNKNAGYGREHIESILASSNRPGGLTMGRTLYVMKAADPNYDRINDLLPGDPEGKVRLFTTIKAALAAVQNYDTVLIGPGNFDEATVITLSNKKGIKIIGTQTGMQWGEGGTCWRDLESTDDLLYLGPTGGTGNQAIEISGITFINVTVGKDAIDFLALNYGTHIHHCSFIGNVGGVDVMDYAIKVNGSNGPDTYIHDCKFDRIDVCAIYATGQRNVIRNNLFIVAASAHGIDFTNGAKEFTCIYDNNFLGSQSSDVGIYFTDITEDNAMIQGNIFSNVATEISTSGVTAGAGERHAVVNYGDDASGGALVDPTST